jgi:hypothetical protein
MWLGVFDDRSTLDHVPGTVILAERDEQPIKDGTFLKRGTGRYSGIILTPQPSNDPNDPLNWSFGTKLIIMLILVLGSCLNASTNGPLLNASLVVLAISFDRPTRGHYPFVRVSHPCRCSYVSTSRSAIEKIRQETRLPVLVVGSSDWEHHWVR